MAQTPLPQDEPEWFRQSALNVSSTHRPDPVHTVWQLPRFRLGTRRYRGRVDHALVFVTGKGEYESFLPPDRPTSVRRYVALYEVDTDPHSFELRAMLPSDIDSHEFEVTADVTWRVAAPDRFVRSQERDVPGLLTRRLLPHMREASRQHPIADSARAERTVQEAVDQATCDGEGLHVICTVRLRRDAVERTHQERLRTARHETEAADPEHELSVLRQQHEAQLRAAKVKFYEDQLAKGGTAALALHLADHPDDTRLVLDHLDARRKELSETQRHLIDQVLEHRALEDYLLEEPRKLTADRMTAILKASPESEDSPATHPELPPSAPTEARPEPEA